jgi:hypothetical protein
MFDEWSLPGEIRVALQAVWRDLVAAGLDISIEALSRHCAGMQNAQVRVGGRVVGQIGIDLVNTAPQRVWHLADQLQEYALETPWGSGEAVTWPLCLSGHPHPMKARILAEDVWWICPREPSSRVRIGRHPGRALMTTDFVDA